MPTRLATPPITPICHPTSRMLDARVSLSAHFGQTSDCSETSWPHPLAGFQRRSARTHLTFRPLFNSRSEVAGRQLVVSRGMAQRRSFK
jgi:hypothetical protein